ncbi:MAG: zeta toxin family protein [Candidatus Thiodiazotropha sp.]
MPENDPYKVKVELEGGIDSTARFSGPDGSILPERRVLHELIAQTVSERHFTPVSGEYEEHLSRVIEDARTLPSYKVLEQAGDYSPEKISAVLDEVGLERLPVHARAEQVMMVTGGPGTGKSSIVSDLADRKPDVYNNAAQINPDHYKDLLAKRTDLGAAHGTYTHWESSMIADDIMDRLDVKMKAGLPAPHVMMDVAAPYPNRMAFAKQFGQMTVVTGTAPPEVTMQRAYSRGFDPDGSIVGRVIPSEIAIGSTAKASELLPNVFEHPDLEFTMVDTNIPLGEKPPVIAEWDNNTKTLTVEDPDTFLDFVERQDINEMAESADELFEGVEQSAEALALKLQPYTDKGVQIDFLNPDGGLAMSISADKVEVHDVELPSKRGSGFMADMAESFGKLGKNGGMIAGVAFGTLSGAFTLAAGGSKAEATEVVYESVVPYGETQFDAVRGDMEAAARSGTIETASNLGAGGGALAGAAIGTAIMPGVGTVVGGVVGAIGGGIGAGYITEKVYDNFESIKSSVVHVSHEAAETLSIAAHETISLLGSAWDCVTGNDESAIDLTAVFNGLPNTITDDMPPEVQALIEVKANSILFERQYEDLKEQGSLSAVTEYMDKNPIKTEVAHAYEDRPAVQNTYAVDFSF